MCGGGKDGGGVGLQKAQGTSCSCCYSGNAVLPFNLIRGSSCRAGTLRGLHSDSSLVSPFLLGDGLREAKWLCPPGPYLLPRPWVYRTQELLAPKVPNLFLELRAPSLGPSSPGWVKIQEVGSELDMWAGTPSRGEAEVGKRRKGWPCVMSITGSGEVWGQLSSQPPRSSMVL